VLIKVLLAHLHQQGSGRSEEPSDDLDQPPLGEDENGNSACRRTWCPPLANWPRLYRCPAAPSQKLGTRRKSACFARQGDSKLDGRVIWKPRKARDRSYAGNNRTSQVFLPA
jgi:hypothetical protein